MNKYFTLLSSTLLVLLSSIPVYAQESASVEERLEKIEKELGISGDVQVRRRHEDKHISHKEEVPTAVTVGGISFGFGATIVVQGTDGNDNPAHDVDETTDGGYSTDLEVTAPVGQNGTAFALVESGDGGGVTGLGVNGDANDAGNMFSVTEMWYEHSVFNSLFTYTLGQLDLSNYFDGNEVANDETFQFLADSFINSTVIDFSEGPGLRFTVSPHPILDVTLGWQENGDDGSPWDNLFGESFYMAEVDLRPEIGTLKGNYRFYGWSDGGSHAKFGDAAGCDPSQPAAGQNCFTETGFGLSFDQQILESVIAFGRYATRDEDVEQWQTAWSAGLGVYGQLWGRKNDAFGIAYGSTRLSDRYKTAIGNAANITSAESHFEAYYSFAFNENFVMTADIQNVSSPRGEDKTDSVLVYGVRTQISF